MLNFSRLPLFLDIVVHYTSVTRKEERDRILPPRSLTFDCEPWPLILSLSSDLTFLGNGKRFLCLIYRLAINLSRTGEVLHEWKIWQRYQNNDTLVHNARPHMWSKEPVGRHSRAHILTSIEELRIDFELKVKKSRSLCVHKLTWVWLCIFFQEGSSVDWDLLGLAAPIAMGQAARQWASLPWKCIVSSHLLKRLSITCEVIKPPTRFFVSATSFSA